MFSILMPVYNGIEYIHESINSVKSQTYKNWELIISVNGHDKDSDVYNIANTYTCDNIIVYDMFGIKGKSNTLNNTLKMCKYDKICILDVDDIWLPTKLEKQLNYIKSYDIIGTDCQYFGDRNDKPRLQFGELSPDIFNHYNPIINSSSCFNKSDALWDNEYDSVEDYEMWLRLIRENKTFYNIDEVLVKHRIHKASCFNASNTQQNVLKKLQIKYKI